MTDASKRTAKDAASVAWAKSMIAYISGRIAGDSQYKKKFANAETVLMNIGYTVFNPARLPEGLEYEQYMFLDFAMIDVSDLVVMLPDWRRSKGAMRERQYATETGKSVEYYETLIKIRMNELEDDAAHEQQRS